MAYDVLETCLLVPDIGRSACAAWVQAWGSIAAIGAAIVIAWWQRRMDRLASIERGRAKAEIAGTSVLLKLSPLRGCCEGVGDQLRQAQKENGPVDFPQFATWFAGLVYPNDKELIAISEHDSTCARLLVRGRNLMEQARMALEAAGRNGKAPASECEYVIGHLLDVLRLAEGQLGKASDKLDAWVPVDAAHGTPAPLK